MGRLRLETPTSQLWPRWLKAREAARYVGLGVKTLKARAQDPASPIKGAPDPDSRRGDWIFDRESLDAYREAQVCDPAVEVSAARLVRELGL